MHTTLLVRCSREVTPLVSYPTHLGPTHARPQGSSTPNQLVLQRNGAAKLDPNLVPSAREAVGHYTTGGGRLTDSSLFGEDPLSENEQSIHQRQMAFHQRYAHSFTK